MREQLLHAYSPRPKKIVECRTLKNEWIGVSSNGSKNIDWLLSN